MILSAYNGQRHLIVDVLRARCENVPEFGMPRVVTTIDKFQGQQSDFVLLSLVRTKQLGHLRDIRRLTIALSRARFGLYIFGHKKLLASCYELAPTMQILLERPTKLMLLPDETYPCQRNDSREREAVTIANVESMAVPVQQLTKHN